METTKKLSALVFLFFTINQAISQPEPESESDLMAFCQGSSRNNTASYNTNLNTVLSTLTNQSSLANYYNLTTGLAPDTVHGMFLCTGDINRTTCNTCVKTATNHVAKNCTNHREAIVYNFDCMVRYSDKFFLSTVETLPNIYYKATDPKPKSFGKFKERLSETMGEVIVRSSLLSSSFTPYYLTDTNQYDQYDLEALVQCTPYLDPRNCTKCLELALQELTSCCSEQSWAFIFTPKCVVSFDISNSSLPSPPSPNHSGSFSIRGNNKILGGMVLAVTSLVFAILGL